MARLVKAHAIEMLERGTILRQHLITDEFSNSRYQCNVCRY